MPEKFFDIIPPEKIVPKKIEEEIREVESTPVIKKKKRYLLKSVIVSVIVLVVITFISSFLFARAEINIWPETKEMALLETITIPAQIVENEKSGSQEFLATGKTTAEGKAGGTIIVYNAYSSGTRTLIPSRFVSADGKLFRSVETVKVPGYHLEKGKIVAGEKEVRVEAAETGADYNIETTTFALPALAGTALYTTIYARSFNPMTGGHKGEVSQVTKDDLEKAEEVLTNRLKSESIDLLKLSLFENLIFPEETVIQDFSGFKSSHSVGTGVESFTVEGNVKSTGIVFKKSDIDKFVKEAINLNIEEGKIAREDTLKINYIIKDTNLEEGKIVVDLDIKVMVYDEIDLDKLKKSIIGKKVNEVEMLLNNLAGVNQVKLISYPFMRRSIPNVLDKIEVKLKFE
ncbi:hypothetical protein KKA24_00620 [Patescibacteria group bacterium]|nr:hypothetical protein [Patescibacteria group bacterium]